MGQAVDRVTSFPSAELGALFGAVERWGWTLEMPTEFAPSQLRRSPPAPTPGEEYATVYGRWRKQIEEEEAAAWARAGTVATWSAHRPVEQYSMAAIFGGTATGWHALVTTIGSSILGSGARLTIINLSERAAAKSLQMLAQKCGYRVRSDTVAPAKSSFDLLGFVGHRELIDFMIDVIHHDEELGSTSAREDRALLKAVAEQLSGPVTSERLQEGLRVLLRERDRPQPGDELSPEEHERLSGMIGQERRERTDVIARTARLEHELAEFVALERSAQLAPPEPSNDIEHLRVIEALRTPNRLDFDFSVRLLTEAAVRQVVRKGRRTAERDVLLILGPIGSTAA